MIRAHFTLPCLYLAQKKIVDRLSCPSLVICLHPVDYSCGSQPTIPRESTVCFLSFSLMKPGNRRVKSALLRAKAHACSIESLTLRQRMHLLSALSWDSKRQQGEQKSSRAILINSVSVSAASAARLGTRGIKSRDRSKPFSCTHTEMQHEKKRCAERCAPRCVGHSPRVNDRCICISCSRFTRETES
jgi:hypothetical protein